MGWVVSNSNAIPNLFVIGAMKCGTTTLHDYLSLHPGIGMSNPKEVNWCAGENSARSLDWYLSHFDSRCSVRGESSQNYTKRHVPVYSGAATRMAALSPGARLIYIVRDPIERYRSHIAENFVGESSEWLSWNRENDHYFKTGLYHWQLEPFLIHYSIDRLLVVELEELAANPLGVMNEVFDFLGVDRISDRSVFDFVSNQNGEEVVPVRVRRHIAYRALKRLVPGLTGTAVSHTVIRRIFFRGSYKPELGVDETDRLREAYADDIAALRSLTGKSFSRWSV